MKTEYLQYLAAEVISLVLPRAMAYRVGCRLGEKACRRDERGRRAVEANLRMVLDFKANSYTQAELERLVFETFCQFGKYLVDFFRYTRLTRRRLDRLVDIVDRHHLEDAVADGKGGIIVTAHLGSWEIGGGAIVTLGHPLNAVFLPQANRRTNALFQRCRRKRGMTVLPLGQAACGSLRALRRGELVALLADRDYSAHNDLVELFGRDVRLPSGPARLCVKAHVPIVPGFLLRQPDDRYILRFHPPIEPDGAESFERVHVSVASVLQQEIAANPSQWFMFEDFWSPQWNHRDSRDAGAAPGLPETD